MSIKEYFETKTGIGIIATADLDGNINQAVYASPHILSEDQIAFIMRDRKTHSNIIKNPKASYLFFEKASGYNGVRFTLTKVKEEKNSKLLFSLRRKNESNMPEEDLFLVIFKIDQEFPLINKK